MTIRLTTFDYLLASISLGRLEYVRTIVESNCFILKLLIEAKHQARKAWYDCVADLHYGVCDKKLVEIKEAVYEYLLKVYYEELDKLY